MSLPHPERDYPAAPSTLPEPSTLSTAVNGSDSVPAGGPRLIAMRPQPVAKRVLDMLVALTLLVLVAPVIGGILALIVMIDSTSRPSLPRPASGTEAVSSASSSSAPWSRMRRRASVS